jgi:Raf kinase inhibitor-like YbhB/YbcL family protein
VLAATLAPGCGTVSAHPSAPPGKSVAALTVTSRSFPSDGPIPVDSTCDGADRSPELSWSAPPAGTRSLAIVVDDPDAPSGDFTHWIAFNIPSDVLSIPEGADPAALGGAVGVNSFNRPGYSGPCPPKGEMHRYLFHVLALDNSIEPRLGGDRAAVASAMSGHLLAEGALAGMFGH